MTDDPDTGVPLDDSPELSLLDLAAVRCLQVRMMTRDVAASGNAKARAVKAPHLEQFVSETLQFLATVEGAAADCGDGVSPDDIIASVPRRAALVDDHPRACQMLIELMVFNPWPDGSSWEGKTRQDELAAAARDLRGATLDDLETLNRELAQVMKQLRRKSIRWGRVAAVTAVGLGAGVVTGGMAAPAIGAAIGGTLGLSGAAATSAGLAALGGGSLAAGGFGVAGGTMLVSSVGGLAAAGVAGTSMRFSRLGSGNIAVDAVKLDLLARAVFTRQEDRDQKMRRVVESLHLTANDLAKKANLLSERIVELKEQNRALRDENSTLRARVTQVRSDLLHRDDEIDRLRAELETIRHERDTVDVVLDRLPAMVDQ